MADSVYVARLPSWKGVRWTTHPFYVARSSEGRGAFVQSVRRLLLGALMDGADAPLSARDVVDGKMAEAISRRVPEDVPVVCEGQTYSLDAMRDPQLAHWPDHVFFMAFDNFDDLPAEG